MPKFNRIAPRYMAKLMAEFGIIALDAAAVFGNLGHESGGLEKLQEIVPTVKRSRGGYGWAQWTGPRRRAYEAWCKKQKIDPASDEANFGFLVFELKQLNVAPLKAMASVGTLREKVVAFELAYERAGAKHYDSRLKWAQRALAAYYKAYPAKANPPLERLPRIDDVPLPAERPLSSQVSACLDDAAADGRISTTELGAGAIAVSGTATAVKETVEAVNETGMTLASFGPWLLLALVTVGFAGYIFWERRRKKVAARQAKGAV